MLGNIRILFLLLLSGIFCIYMRLDMHLVFSISIQFSNTVVTVRNEPRKILEHLMHFCYRSHYVMCKSFLQTQPFTYTSKYFQHCLFGFCSSFLVCHVLLQHFKFIYLLSDYKYFDANLFVLMRCTYVNFRQNLSYIYTVYFDICTTLFQQFLMFNTKYFKQICEVYLLTPLKMHFYINK